MMQNHLKNQLERIAVCVCLCISTLLNKSRLTADLISRKQDLIFLMISLRKTCECTNWLSSLYLATPPSFSPFALHSSSSLYLSVMSLQMALSKSSDCVSDEKKNSVMSLLTYCSFPWFSRLYINGLLVFWVCDCIGMPHIVCTQSMQFFSVFQIGLDRFENTSLSFQCWLGK